MNKITYTILLLSLLFTNCTSDTPTTKTSKPNLDTKSTVVKTKGMGILVSKNTGLDQNTLEDTTFHDLKSALKVPEEVLASQTNDSDEITPEDSSFYDLKTALKFPEQVKHLSITDTGISKVPEEVLTFKNLESLNLGFNNFTTFPDLKYVPKGIKTLELTANKIRNFPDNISELKSLEYLNLSHNKFVEIPREISVLAKFKSLKQLDLSYNQLVELPRELGVLTNLKSLNVSTNTELKVIPNSIHKLKSLEELNADVSILEQLKPNSNELTKLVLLKLNNSTLKPDIFSSNIQYLKNLEKIEILGPVVSIPKSISALNNLRTLDLIGNNSEELAPGLEHLPNISELSLTFCNIKTLDFKINKDNKIKKLDLSHNRIEYLPHNISVFSQLEELDLSYNDIRPKPELIEIIGSLKNLRTVKMQNGASNVINELKAAFPNIYFSY